MRRQKWLKCGDANTPVTEWTSLTIEEVKAAEPDDNIPLETVAGAPLNAYGLNCKIFSFSPV